MSWLRLDDAYGTHPKLLELEERHRWRWTTVLLHCARYRTAGRIHAGELQRYGVGPALIARLLELRLLEADGAGGRYLVHDWHIYNPPRDPTGPERVRAWRDRQRAPEPPAHELAGALPCPHCARPFGNAGALARHERACRYRPDVTRYAGSRSTTERRRIKPEPLEPQTEETSGLEPERNALQAPLRTPDVTVLPVPVTTNPPKPPRDRTPDAPPRRRRSSSDPAGGGNLESIGTSAAAELERLQSIADDPPAWGSDTAEWGSE